MPNPPGKTVVGCYVDRDLAEKFAALASCHDGGVSGVLRRFVIDQVEGRSPAPPPGPAGYQIRVRLKDRERVALLAAAQARATTPANWLRSLAIVHLARTPQWNDTEVQELRELFGEVRRIGNNVNQIAHALNLAALSGDCPPDQGEAALEAVKLLQSEMRRIVSVMTGNFDYWGLPSDERPQGSLDAALREDMEARAAKRRIRLRPRRRPKRFEDS